MASSSPHDRLRAGLEAAGLLRRGEAEQIGCRLAVGHVTCREQSRFEEARVRVDPASCIVIEDSVPGVAAAVAAGMTAIGFVGGNEMDSVRRHPGLAFGFGLGAAFG